MYIILKKLQIREGPWPTLAPPPINSSLATIPLHRGNRWLPLSSRRIRNRRTPFLFAPPRMTVKAAAANADLHRKRPRATAGTPYSIVVIVKRSKDAAVLSD